jgi:hypothetical protein
MPPHVVNYRFSHVCPLIMMGLDGNHGGNDSEPQFSNGAGESSRSFARTLARVGVRAPRLVGTDRPIDTRRTGRRVVLANGELAAFVRALAVVAVVGALAATGTSAGPGTGRLACQLLASVPRSAIVTLPS